MRKANLRLHPGKCHLLWRKTTVLGHIISVGGMATDLAKVVVVKELTR